MLTLSTLREEKTKVLEGLAKKNFHDAESVVNEIIATDDKRKAIQQELNALQSFVNQASGQIGQLMKSGQASDTEAIKAEVSEKKSKTKALEAEMAETESILQGLLVKLPNLPAAIVPKGKTADDNETIFTYGTPPNLGENAKPHWELIKDYDIIDFELGNKISGAGFPVYKGKGARLQRALINFFLDEAMAQGYTEIQPPIVVNEASGFGTGQLPDKDGQMYFVPEDGLYLIPTAEVPITNLYRDVILKPSDLPIKNVGFTPCFRREAGSWGAHVRGLNRLHQFDKVEIVQVTEPENSYATLEDMRHYVEGLLQKLELPYRVLRLCGGDMSFSSALTYDMEVYSAAQGRWLEVSSVSNFEAFQANRLKLRCKDEINKKNYLLHTLNGSALALPRIVAALLENNQTADGIKIPKVLQPYTGFDTIS